MTSLDLVFYTEGLPFHGGSLEEASLGGSETAVLSMARELAQRGHEVRVYCHCPRPGEYERVRYQDVSDFPRFVAGDECDVFICCRFFHVLGRPLRAKLVWLWNHDVMVREAAPELMSLLYKVDRLLVLSEFHKQQLLRHLPIPEDRFLVTRNGVDLDLIDRAIAGVARNPDRLIYTSRPERGLEVLLDLWPRLKQARPQLELALASYQHPAADEQMRDFVRSLEAKAAEAGGVRFLGNLPKRDLYREIASSRLMVYPSIFPEVSCISALEAAACGTPIVASKYCALKETVADGETGLLIPGDPRLDGRRGTACCAPTQYRDRFAEATLRLLNDDGGWQRLSAAGRARVEARYQWKKIAAEWEDEMRAFFARQPSDAVFRHLVHHSDLEAARLLRPGDLPETDFLRDAQSYRKHYDDAADLAGEDLGEKGVTETLRFQWLARQLGARPEIAKILDAGSGLGWFSWGLSNLDPKYRVTGVEISSRLAEKAKDLLPRYAQNPEQVRFLNCALEEFEPEENFDAALLFEVLEHVVDPRRIVSAAERSLSPGGWVFATVPFGPWESMSFEKEARRFHVRSFTRRDLEDLLGAKEDLTLEFARAGRTPRGEEIGYFLVSWRATGQPTGVLRPHRKLTCRPRQTLSVCMIVKDAQGALYRCLESVRPIADQLIIYDTGSRDNTRQIARQFTDEVYDIPWEDDFGEARNRSVEKATGDWILWIDADEYLLGGENLPRYLRDNMYRGYVIRQHHHALDAQFKPDLPVRVYRNGLGIKFYGVIHEHPELALNQGITPSVILSDVHIMHDGYVTEAIRRSRFLRNLPLLMKDRERFPDRRLGLVFLERDYIHLARYDLERTRGQMTPRAQEFLRRAAALHRDHFLRESDPLHAYSYPLYQSALALLDEGFEVGHLLIPMLNGKASLAEAAPERRRFESEADLRRFLDDRITALFAELRPEQEFPFEASQAVYKQARMWQNEVEATRDGAA
jgi:glycosyltransferase involved in cell wall biosynthesis/ubiquinone/menaquinone biosynthesis C-methylase UbiE